MWSFAHPNGALVGFLQGPGAVPPAVNPKLQACGYGALTWANTLRGAHWPVQVLTWFRSFWRRTPHDGRL